MFYSLCVLDALLTSCLGTTALRLEFEFLSCKVNYFNWEQIHGTVNVPCQADWQRS